MIVLHSPTRWGKSALLRVAGLWSYGITSWVPPCSDLFFSLQGLSQMIYLQSIWTQYPKKIVPTLPLARRKRDAPTTKNQNKLPHLWHPSKHLLVAFQQKCQHKHLQQWIYIIVWVKRLDTRRTSALVSDPEICKDTLHIIPEVIILLKRKTVQLWIWTLLIDQVQNHQAITVHQACPMQVLTQNILIVRQDRQQG